MPRPTEILPSHYYYDHFHEMVRFVIGIYGEMFEERELRFLEEFPKLSMDAQCVFVRMSNRKRPIFRIDDLIYSEIDNVIDALDELVDNGWVRGIGESDYRTFASTLSKQSLVNVLKSAGCAVFRSSWKKDRLTSHVLSAFTFAEFNNFYSTARHFVPLHQETFQFLLYLYFGKTNNSLTNFALRDLGIINAKEKQTYSARFADMAEAQASFAYGSAIKRLKTGRAEDFDAVADDFEGLPSTESDYARGLRNALLHMLGQHYEKAKNPAVAISFYDRSDSFECRERLIRLLYADGQKDRVDEMLKTVLADPSCDDEYFFAADFYARKYGKQKTSAVTDLLRSGQTISVDEYYRGSAEQAVVRHYKKSGWAGCHLENSLWTATFGLLFWNELFEQPGALSSGFDRLPHLLRTKDFGTRYASEISEKLEAVSEGAARNIIDDVCHAHFGETNGIFRWFDGIQEIVGHFLSKAPPAALRAILQRMTEDYFGMIDSFPDLFLVRGDAIKFVEVKAEGDQIRRSQLTRFMQMKNAGFDVEIVRVSYHVDPDQIYVVVDVETTGGRPPADRVTEIGAVKVQNGRVIAEWSSLINPQRHIPGFITGITGITNDMVADAPLFADIAQGFLEFMDDAVFAAHNVNFDYGFIASEFRRLEIPFKMPKVCTCASMRRHYPGSASYSLGNLCAEYKVPLPDHHRALCDAKAAAGLLLMVNEKRISDHKTAQAA